MGRPNLSGGYQVPSMGQIFECINSKLDGLYILVRETLKVTRESRAFWEEWCLEPTTMAAVSSQFPSETPHKIPLYIICSPLSSSSTLHTFTSHKLHSSSIHVVFRKSVSFVSCYSVWI